MNQYQERRPQRNNAKRASRHSRLAHQLVVQRHRHPGKSAIDRAISPCWCSRGKMTTRWFGPRRSPPVRRSRPAFKPPEDRQGRKNCGSCWAIRRSQAGAAWARGGGHIDVVPIRILRKGRQHTDDRHVLRHSSRTTRAHDRRVAAKFLLPVTVGQQEHRLGAKFRVGVCEGRRPWSGAHAERGKKKLR